MGTLGALSGMSPWNRPHQAIHSSFSLLRSLGLQLQIWGWTSVQLLSNWFRTFIGSLTAETLYRENLIFRSGCLAFSFYLKREKRSRHEFFSFAGPSGEGNGVARFDLDDFDRLIEAADQVQDAKSSAITTSPKQTPVLGYLSDLFLKAETLWRIDTPIYKGNVTVSIRLMQNRRGQYIAIGTPMFNDYALELGEFHQFVAAAKRVRAASRSYAAALSAATSGT
jgi:hypothetical protein